MNDIVRSGSFTFRVDVNWAKLPEGWELIDVADIVVDFNDRVIVNSRGGHPIIIFDRDGNVLSSWGKDVFVRPPRYRTNQIFLADSYPIESCRIAIRAP